MYQYMKNKFSSMSKAESLIPYYQSRSIINEAQLEKKHILFIGDSFIYSVNVDYKYSISSQFERLLDKSDVYSVFNLGLPGGSLDSSILRLQQWCNSYGNQIHSVYFGITSPARFQHWVNEDHTFNYIPGHAPPIEKTVDNEILISRTLDRLIAGSEFQTSVKLDHTMQHLKNISKLHNFNVFSFYTANNHFEDDYKIMDLIKEHLEDEKFKIYVEDLRWMNTGDYIISDDNRHWNEAGHKYMADNVLYPETNHWYI